jgi:RND superfamily putative drug exporter
MRVAGCSPIRRRGDAKFLPGGVPVAGGGKLLGVGMATAIFVDATVVQMVLLPTLMELFGRANWWKPGWLERKPPRLDVEPPPTPGSG